MKNLIDRMGLYMDAGFPILYLETFEEDKALKAIQRAAGNKPMLEWNVRGLFNHREKDLSKEGMGLADALWHFTNRQQQITKEAYAKKFDLNHRILVLKDIQAQLDQPEIIAQLKHLSELITSGEEITDCCIIILAPSLKIPHELEHYITILSMDHLGSNEIQKIVLSFCEENELDESAIPKDNFLKELVQSLKGLSEFEIRNLLALALADDGEITKADISRIHEQKEQMVKKSGIMEMIHLKETIDDIGGLDNLKTWLRRKAKILKDTEAAAKYGVDMPKGVLIAGLPGCGKSLNAKAAAALFDVPLLRMDMGRLMGKYVGESEANLRRAIELAEAISPCVLWIDELEKAFAGIGGSGGGAEVTTRLFGTFLTWMQEKDGLAFVVATANDITRLPPELLRKGRFDEIFYVGLPNPAERAKIFSIHIKKRRPQDLGKIDLKALVDKTYGYSGADIEGVVKDAIEAAFTEDKPALTTELLLKAIENTASLSEIMKDSIGKMAENYKKNKFKNASS